MSQVTTGASSDFNQATSTAEAMVTQYGMSDAVGVRVFHDNKSSRQELVSSEINKLLNVRRHSSLFLDFVPDFFFYDRLILPVQKETRIKYCLDVQCI